MPEGELFVTLIGWVASVLASVCFMPQAYKVYRTRTTEGLSLASFSMLVSANFSWLVYGAALGNLPLIATNVCALAANGLILAFILRERVFNAPKQKAVAPDLPQAPVSILEPVAN